MKSVKWKILIITCIVCLSPILLGIAFWNDLPDTLAIHFNIKGDPDNFTSKSFFIFAIPFLMAVFQGFCCIMSDINSHKHNGNKKFEKTAKCIIPITTVILYTATLGYGMGQSIDMRKVALFIVGGMFIAMGNYLPKIDYIKHYKIDTQAARKINRLSGYVMVIMGVLALITIFLPPITSVIWLLLLIPFVIILSVYTIKAIKK